MAVSEKVESHDLTSLSHHASIGTVLILNYSNNGPSKLRWSSEEIQTLKLMKSENKSDVEISTKLVGRTAEAVGIKWIRLTQYVNLCSLFIVEDNSDDENSVYNLNSRSEIVDRLMKVEVDRNPVLQ